MKTYSVVIPIAGHAFLDVEAESEEDAIDKAIDEVTIDNIEQWEGLRRFNEGNFCYCPTPWEASAKEESGDD